MKEEDLAIYYRSMKGALDLMMVDFVPCTYALIGATITLSSDQKFYNIIRRPGVAMGCSTDTVLINEFSQ